MPDEYVKKLKETRVFMAASLMIRQLEFGMTDMELHSKYDPFGDEFPFMVHRRIVEKTNVIPPLERARMMLFKEFMGREPSTVVLLRQNNLL